VQENPTAKTPGFEGISLCGADFSGRDLRLYSLRYAVFREASLKGCKLPMDLEGIDFTRCDLSGFDFRGRNIKEATFGCATLTDCDLSTCINAENVDFSSCIDIDGARLPANKLAFDDHMNEWLGRQKGRGVRLELEHHVMDSRVETSMDCVTTRERR
jgi:uncharacterized protein YjbI with pentapeptide repeats